MSSRNSQIEPLEVLGILPNTGQIAAAPTVSQHIACPSSPAPSAGSTGRHSFQSHSRNVSLTAEANVTAPPRSNRFSMSFPTPALRIHESCAYSALTRPRSACYTRCHGSKHWTDRYKLLHSHCGSRAESVRAEGGLESCRGRSRQAEEAVAATRGAKEEKRCKERD